VARLTNQEHDVTPQISQFERNDKPKTTPRLTILIVNHAGWPDVVALVDSLAQSASFDEGACEIVVVDNATPGPIPRSIVDRTHPGFRLIVREINGGFAAGVNTGWRASRGEWLLVLNPDIVASADLIEGVLERVDGYAVRKGRPAPGIVGFALRNEDGSHQPSVGVFPSLTRCVREQFIPRSRRKYRPARRVRAGSVSWVTGACVLLNSEMMLDLGGMDEDFFLYHEEVALCRRARWMGWDVEYDPTLAVVHAKPLQNRPITPQMRVILRHSKLLYFRKYLPRGQFDALAAIVAAESKVRGFWARRGGNEAEARAWRLIGEITRSLRDDFDTAPKGTAVLELALSATSPKTPRIGDHPGRIDRESPPAGPVRRGRDRDRRTANDRGEEIA
jgi:GT2 family glycosyltransferase